MMVRRLSTVAILSSHCFIFIVAEKQYYSWKKQRASPSLSRRRYRSWDGAAIAFPPSSTLTPNFQQSLEARGANFDGIAIKRGLERYSETERTMIATEDAPAGRVLIRIPVSLCVTASSAVEDYKAVAAANREKERSDIADTDLLAIWVLSKRHEMTNDIIGNDRSDSDPYISSLPVPKELEHFPVYWNEDDAAWLEGSTLRDYVGERKQDQLRTFEKLTEIIPQFDRIAPTVAHWTWAKSIARSRAFSIPNPLLESAFPGTCIGEDDVDEDNTENMNRVPALVPFADMFNHVQVEDGCSAEWGIDRDSGDFLVRTLKDVRAGSEITLSYGSAKSHSASAMLLNYGFIYESPTSDDATSKAVEFDGSEELHSEQSLETLVAITLSLDIISKSSGLERAKDSVQDKDDPHVLKEVVWARDEDRYPAWGWGPLERVVANGIGNMESAKSTMSLLRVGVATSDEMYDILEANSEASEDMAIAAAMAREPIGWRNERAALRAFECIVNNQLKSYPDHDTGLNQNQLNALKVVDLEKTVLWHWASIARMAGDALDRRCNDFDFGLKYAQLFEELLGTTQRIPAR